MRTWLFFLFFLYSINSFAQFGLFGAMDGGEAKIHRDKIKGWTEIESERTLHSSAYLKPDGVRVDYFSKEAVNYFDVNGKLQPVSTIPQQSSDGWHAAQQQTPFSVSIDGKIFTGGITLSDHQSFNGESAESVMQSETIRDTVILRNIVPGVDKYFQFRNNGIKYSYVIQQPVSINGDLTVEEEIHLPGNYTISLQDKNSETPGFVFIFDENGSVVYTIAPVWCYDASGKNVTGNYELEKLKDQHYRLKLIVPQNYFLQSGITYPVVVDPLVTGPTSTWTGGAMPSCFTPNFNVDSLLITVPAQITVSSLNVTSNYYANPFTTTVMADGNMFFSTSCGQSTNFTVAPPTGNTAGTAYLDDFNLNSPLMCCRVQNCQSYTFYLRMHLQRTTNGTTCNTSYLYYDPTSLWPFSAYVVGNTVENYGSQATILNPSVCANECEFQLRTYTRYGVPPFTVTHPWLTTPFTSGVPAGCSSSFTIQTVTLTIPNCPNNCDPSTSLAVPAPTVTDACGNTVSSWPNLSLTIKPVANVSAADDTVIVCSGEEALLNLSPCLPGVTINWYGHNTNGTGTSILDSMTQNTSSSLDTILYEAYADLNGCIGDTAQFIIITEPDPIADFSVVPDPVFILDNVLVDDQIQTPGTIASWYWDESGNFISSDSSANLIFAEPGVYAVCLAVQTQNSCVDTVCKNITVLPLEIVLPNVISPNGDLFNETLEFTYLEFFDSNHLTILNRWGNVLYEKDNYQNDWDGDGLSEGVYYFVLIVEDKEYSGYFHLMR